MDGTLQWRPMSAMTSQIICNQAVYSTTTTKPEPHMPPKLYISGPPMSMSWHHNATDVQLQPLGFPHIIHLQACITIAGSKSRDNRPISQIPPSICFISHNAPFRTEICTFLFWMVHCGIWNRSIVGFFNQVKLEIEQNWWFLKDKTRRGKFLQWTTSFYLVVIISFLVRVMALCLTGGKSLPEPTMTQFTNASIPQCVKGKPNCPFGGDVSAMISLIRIISHIDQSVVSKSIVNN